MKAEEIIILEVEKQNLKYRMEIPKTGTLGDAYQANIEFMNELIRLMKENAEKTQSESPPIKDEELKEEEEDE